MITKTTTTTDEKTRHDDDNGPTKKRTRWATTGGRPRGREKDTVSTSCAQGGKLARKTSATSHHLVCSLAFLGFSAVITTMVSDALGA